MKTVKTLILSHITLLLSFSSLTQASSLDEILKERSELARQAEQNSDSLKHLNEEKKILIEKLMEVNRQHEEILDSLEQKKELSPVSISAQEIAQYIEGKRMGRCKLTHGEYAGEYIIKKDDIKIRFAFLPKRSSLAPTLSLVKGELNENLWQIEQTGYNPDKPTQKGDVQSTIRLRVGDENFAPGDIVHAVFMGQRLNDKWFGQSSYSLTNVTCAVGH